MRRASLEALFDRYLRERDERAMEEVVRRTRPRLLAIARRIAGPNEADDCAQTAYLSLIHKQPGEMDAPLLPWLVTAVVRIAYGRRAKREKHARLADQLAHIPEPNGPLRAAMDAEEAQLLRRLIDRLPEAYRDAVVLHYFHGLSTRGVGQLLGLSADAVKKRLQRARGALRRRWGRALGPLLLSVWLLRDQAAPLTGVVLMHKKTIAVAALLVALLGAGAVILHRSGPARDSALRRAERQGHSDADTVQRKVSAQAGQPAAPEAPPAVDLSAVDRGRDLHGIVVDPDGRPVAGARLQVVVHPWRRTSVFEMEVYDTVVPGAATKSARDGTFALRLRAGDLVQLRVEAEGFAPLEVSRLQAGERVRIELAPAVRLVVLVRNEEKQALAGVRLRLRRYGARGDVALDRYGTTDAGGRFVFRDLPPGLDVSLTARHEDYAQRGRASVTLPREDAAEHALEMLRGRELRGVVVDDETGAPIANARVGRGWTLRPGTVTDADGRFSLHHAPQQNYAYEIHAVADGYGRHSEKLASRDEYTFRLKRGDTVIGVLLDPRGAPVAGAPIGVIASAGPSVERRLSLRHGVSGPGGRFLIDGLAHDLIHTLIVFPRGFGRTLVDFDPHPGEPGTIDLGEIRLPAARRIAGRVVDGGGQPVARTEIDLEGANDDRGRLLKRRRPKYEEPYHGKNEERLTDDLGRFCFPDLSPGSYRLHVSKPGNPPVRQDLELTAEADLLAVEIRLAGGRRFAVVVEDENGDPVPGAVVSALHDGGGSRARTGEDGRAVLTVVGKIRSIGPPWVLSFGSREQPPYLPAESIEDLPAERTEARFVLRIGKWIQGGVVDPDGRPLGRAILELRQGAESLQQWSTDDRGNFRVAVPGAGTVDVLVRGRYVSQKGLPGHQQDTLWSGELRGVAPGATGLTLVARPVPRDRKVRVVVLTPDGDPLPGVTVYFQPAPLDHAARPPVTGADGSVTLAELPASEIEIRVSFQSQKDFVPPKPATVVPESQEVVLRCREGILLSGVVVLAGGTPASGASVNALRDGILVVVRADDAGHFRVLVPVEGEGPLRLFTNYPGPDGKTHSGHVHVDSPEDEVRLELR
ncbi:MAG: sigma-70 family RNA polymerase sigma factor [Planctomycetota bacterium]|jgi:RNA polymerase sigma-70 factor (ECF subfamily)